MVTQQEIEFENAHDTDIIIAAINEKNRDYIEIYYIEDIDMIAGIPGLYDYLILHDINFNNNTEYFVIDVYEHYNYYTESDLWDNEIWDYYTVEELTKIVEKYEEL